MAQCRVEDQIELSASAEAVWGLVGDFANLSWIPGIADVAMTVEGSGVGALRSLELEGDLVVERLEAYEEGKSHSYSISGGPLPITNYLAVIQVEATSAGSVMSWVSDFDVKHGPVADAEKFVTELYAAGLAAVKSELG